MDSIEQKLHNVIQKYGEPVELESYLGYHQEFLVRAEREVKLAISNYCESRGLDAPDFVFTSGTTPRAFAHSEKIIGITIARAVILLRYFQSGLVRSGILKCQNDTNSVANFINDPLDVSQYLHEPIPQKSHCLSVSEDLALLSLVYIAGHELGHLTLGHLSTNATSQTWCWDEDELASDQPHHIDKVAMEFGADRFAAGILIGYLECLGENNKNQFLHYALIMLYSLFHLDYRAGNPGRGIFDRDHPPAQFRGITGVTCLAIFAEEIGYLSKGEIDVELSKSFSDALNMYLATTGIKTTFEVISEYGSWLKSFVGRNNELIAHYKLLFPDE